MATGPAGAACEDDAVHGKHHSYLSASMGSSRAALRRNRLALLARIRMAADTVADFSKIAG